jgi:hypothetical protein
MQKIIEEANQFIGKRIVVTAKDHPHSGKHGEIVRLESTAIGYGFVAKADDNSEFMIFKAEDIEWENNFHI